MLDVYLSGLLGTRLSLRGLVEFRDILFPIHVNFMLGHIMLLFCVTCVVLLTIIANSCPYYACYAQPYFASPRDNTDVLLTLFDLSLPLAQCMGFQGVNLLGMMLGSIGIVHVWSWKMHLTLCIIWLTLL